MITSRIEEFQTRLAFALFERQIEETEGHRYLKAARKGG